MRACAILLTYASLVWFSGCGGGPVQQQIELSMPVSLYCSFYHLEYGRWPESREELESFDIRSTRLFTKLPRYKRRALSALDWRKCRNMTFGQEGGDLRVRLDYRNEGRGVDATEVDFTLHHTGHKWGPGP